MRFVWTMILASVAFAQPADAQTAEGDETGTEASTDAMDMAAQHMDDERARRHFEAGRNLYDAGAFERAGREFEEAYRLSSRPELLYNVYVAHRDAGNVGKAAAALRQYLDEMEEAPDRVNLEARLQSLEEQAAALEAAEQARLAEEEARAEAETSAGTPDPEPQPVEESGPNIVPWVIAGVGAAALIAGAVTGVMALGAVSDIEEQCPDDACEPDFDLAGERDDARTLVRATDFLLLGGTLLVAGGLAWALLGVDDEERAPVAAACGPGGCMAELRGRF